MQFRLMFRLPRLVVATAGCAIGLSGSIGALAQATDASPNGIIGAEMLEPFPGQRKRLGPKLTWERKEIAIFPDSRIAENALEQFPLPRKRPGTKLALERKEIAIFPDSRIAENALAVRPGGEAISRVFSQAWEPGRIRSGSAPALVGVSPRINAAAPLEAMALAGFVRVSERPDAFGWPQSLRVSTDVLAAPGLAEGGAANESPSRTWFMPDSIATAVPRADAMPLDANSHGTAMWGAQAVAAWRFAATSSERSIPASAAAADLVIAGLHRVVLDVGRHAKTLGFQGRRGRLDPVIRKSFDLAGMAQFAVDEHWWAMSDAQHHALIENFSRIMIAVFADRFDFYYDHSFETINVKTLDDGAVRVDTDLVLPIGHRVRIAYVLRPVHGTWRIIDVLPPPGYSEAFARRDEYLSVINRRGINGFFVALEMMVASLEVR